MDARGVKGTDFEVHEQERNGYSGEGRERDQHSRSRDKTFDSKVRYPGLEQQQWEKNGVAEQKQGGPEHVVIGVRRK